MQFWTPDDGRKNRLKHVERLTQINKLWNVASCWLFSVNILAMHGPMNVKSFWCLQWEPHIWHSYFLHSIKSSKSSEHVSIVLSLNYNDAWPASGIDVGGREGFKSMNTLSPVFCWQFSPICGTRWCRMWLPSRRMSSISVGDQWMTANKCICRYLDQGWVYSASCPKCIKLKQKGIKEIFV